MSNINRSNVKQIGSNAELLVDTTLSVSQTGWHYIGGTSGRGTQEILDVTNYNDLIIELERTSSESGGNIRFVFYGELGQADDFAQNDEKVMHILEINPPGEDESKLYTSNEYPVLGLNWIGFTVYFGGPTENFECNCKIIGGVN